MAWQESLIRRDTNLTQYMVTTCFLSLPGSVTLRAGPPKLRKWVAVFASLLSYLTLTAVARSGLTHTITWPANQPIKPLKQHQRQCFIPRSLTLMNQALCISHVALSSTGVWAERAGAEFTAWLTWLLYSVKDAILSGPGRLCVHLV